MPGPPSLARSTVLNFADTAISVASAVLVSVILARALGPEKFGLYSLVTTVQSLVYLLACMGITETVRRYVAELDAQASRPLAGIVAGRSLLHGLGAAGIAAAVMVLAAQPLATFFRQGALRVYFILAAAMLLPMVGAGILRAVLRGVQRYDYFVRINLMTAPLWVAGCILAVLRGGGIAAILGVGFLVQLVIVGALATWAHREVGLQWRARLPQPLRSRVVRYSVMLAALVVLNGIVWKRSELLFLGRFHGPEQMAFYAVPFAIAERLSMLLPGALLGVLLPGLTYAYGAADPERFSAMFSQALQYLAMLTLPICLLGISLAPGLIRLVYGPRFGGAIAVLQILLIAMAFGVLGQAASAALLGMERQGWLLKTGAAAAVVSIGLNLLLIPPYGAVGAAVANTLTQAGWALAAFLPLRGRVLPSSRLAILQAAGAAVAVAALLAVTLVLQVTPLTLALSGVVALTVYAFALERMHLFSPRLVIQRLRPNA